MNFEDRVIRIPVEVFETAESKDDIEDWLLARNAGFLERLRRARAQDLAGDLRSLDDVERDLRTPS